MKIKILVIFLFFFVFLMNACCIDNRETIKGNGDLVKQEREIKGVEGLKVSNFVDVRIQLGDEEKLVLEAEENIQDIIITEVVEGRLIIKTKPGFRIRTQKRAIAHLTVKGLNSITITSSGDVKAPDLVADTFKARLSSSGDLTMGGVKAEDVEIRLSSSGDVKMDYIKCSQVELLVSSSGDIALDKLNAKDLVVRISSSGDIRISDGNVTTQTIRQTSAGDYKARNLISERANVQLSSSGSATISVNEVLKATTTSSGSVSYYGSPKVDSRRTSSGKVYRR